MEVKQCRLRNVGRFKELEIPLAPLGDLNSNVTVFVGNNGSGKTSILGSIARGLSWLSGRILRGETGKGASIPEHLIFNGADSASISIQLEGFSGLIDSPSPEWKITRVRKGRHSEERSQLNMVSVVANYYRENLTRTAQFSLPLIAYYPVERVVNEQDVFLKAKEGGSNFDQTEAFTKAVNEPPSFKKIFEWIRARTEIENSQRLPDKALQELRQSISEQAYEELLTSQKDKIDPQLEAVRQAIYAFMPGFENLRIQYLPSLQLLIDKHGETLDVQQLSQGEKSLLALIGDVAHRLTMLNPALENPLTGDGIVLIDEVDMHLHPKWQRSLIKQLTSTFPNCQFVLTTHSPLVISDCKNVLTYLIGDDELKRLPPLYGEDANTVLLEIMDTDVRNAQVNEKLNDLLDAIHDSEVSRAKAIMAELESDLPASNLELSKAKLLLRKKELKLAKDN